MVPTIATESPHAVATALSASVGLSFESTFFDDDLAAREPAVGVHVVAPGLHAVPRALEQAGADRVVHVGDDGHGDRRGGDADLGAVSVAVLQALLAAVVGVVVPPRPPLALPPPLLLPLLHAVTTSTKAVARTHQRSRILFSPRSLDGPKRTDIVHACRSEPGAGFANIQHAAGARGNATIRRPIGPSSRRRPEGSIGRARRLPRGRSRDGRDDSRLPTRSMTWPSASLPRGTRRATSPPSRTIAVATRLAARVLARPRREPGRLPRAPGRAALGAARAGRRRRAARVPERVPAPRQRALRGHRSRPRRAPLPVPPLDLRPGGPAARSAVAPRVRRARDRRRPVPRSSRCGRHVGAARLREPRARTPSRSPSSSVRFPATPRGPASTSSAAPRRCRSRRRATGRR